MQVKLAKKGPAMWFLGEPKNLKISLTFGSPGPVECDFNSLTEAEQRQVLAGIKQCLIETDIPFEELYREYSKHLPPTLSTKGLTPDVGSSQEKTSLLDKATQQAQKRKQRAVEFLSKPISQIQAQIKKETNLSLLRAMLEEEEGDEGACRRTVVCTLQARLRKLQKEVKVKLQDSEKEPPVVFKQPIEEKTEDVVESVEETISLTMEELAALASGNTVGGED